MAKIDHGVLIRDYTSLEGTPGHLWVKVAGQYQKFCCSLELPWFNNANGISCIPAGLYECELTFSPKYKRMMYLVKSVPNRRGIRCHSANFAGSILHGYRSDLLGCLAFGQKLFGGPGTNTQLMLQSSRVAMRRVNEHFGGRNFFLTIVGDFPCPAS